MKNTIIAIVVIVVLVVGYLWWSSNSTQAPTTDVTDTINPISDVITDVGGNQVTPAN